ncbi:MAG: DNA primase regulatory subunit PriL, partial [Candidatus Syntropharchaeia archaeon]
MSQVDRYPDASSMHRFQMDYPFTSSALKYVSDLGITLDEFVNRRGFDLIRIRGKERVIQAIKGEILPGEKKERELLSYPFARILVSCIRDPYLIKRYALAEAKFAYRRLKEEKPEFLKRMGEELGISSLTDGENFKVYFGDYLRFSKRLRERRWKLTNRLLEKGWVYLERTAFARILQEAIQDRIEKDLPAPVPEEICDSLKRYITEIKEELSNEKPLRLERFGKVNEDSFPPCISRIISDVKKGLNIPHSARFALTSFLLKIGMEEKEIIDIYRTSPDFDEEKTRYQVRHIASKNYTPPSCSTMRTYGN